MSSVHDVVMERAASVAAYGTSGAVAVTGLTMQHLFGLIGVALAAATFAINWYYRQRHLDIAARELEILEWRSAAQNRIDNPPR